VDPRIVVARFLCEFIGDDPDTMIPRGPSGAQPDVPMESSDLDGLIPSWTAQLKHADDLLRRLK